MSCQLMSGCLKEVDLTSGPVVLQGVSQRSGHRPNPASMATMISPGRPILMVWAPLAMFLARAGQVAFHRVLLRCHSID